MSGFRSKPRLRGGFECLIGSHPGTRGNAIRWSVTINTCRYFPRPPSRAKRIWVRHRSQVPRIARFQSADFARVRVSSANRSRLFPYGYGCRATFMARMAAQRRMREGAVFKIISQGSQSTRRASQRTRNLARQLGPRLKGYMIDVRG